MGPAVTVSNAIISGWFKKTLNLVNIRASGNGATSYAAGKGTSIWTIVTHMKIHEFQGNSGDCGGI